MDANCSRCTNNAVIQIADSAPAAATSLASYFKHAKSRPVRASACSWYYCAPFTSKRAQTYAIYSLMKVYKHDCAANAQREPIMRVWGQTPVGTEAAPHVRRSGRVKPTVADGLGTNRQRGVETQRLTVSSSTLRNILSFLSQSFRRRQAIGRGHSRATLSSEPTTR